MKLLCMDTATNIASVAVVEENKVLGEINLNFKNNHSAIIMDMVIDILKTLSLSLDDIHGFVVSKGPGSFTGLRIGISTIKGLCHGLNKPFVGVSSLDALAISAMHFNGIIAPIINALSENVYTCFFKNIDGALNKITDYMFISIYELHKLLNAGDDILFIGDAVDNYGDALKKLFPCCILGNSLFNYTKASNLGYMGIKAFKEGCLDDIATFSPLYIKKSYVEDKFKI